MILLMTDIEYSYDEFSDNGDHETIIIAYQLGEGDFLDAPLD